MTRTTARSNIPHGFTYVELNIALTIGMFILAGVVSTYLMCVKSFQAVANYAEIHKGGREAVNYFAKDMRAVYAISSFNNSTLTVTIPTNFTSTGSVNGTKTVTYTYTQSISNAETNGWLKRYDSNTGVTSTLASNIYFLQYSLYDHVGSTTALTSVAKSIAVEIKLRKSIISQIQSEDYISARMDMRNKP